MLSLSSKPQHNPLSLSLSLFFLLCSSHFSDTQPQNQIKIQIPLSPSLSQIIVHACLDLHTYKSQPTNPNQNSFVLAYPKPTNGSIINPQIFHFSNPQTKYQILKPITNQIHIERNELSTIHRKID